MRLVIQRVLEASVAVDNNVISSIQNGLLVLYGFSVNDTENIFEKVIHKIVELRIFPDEYHGINASVEDNEGGILIVSQFTLMADTKKGRRPSFIKAMPPEKAREFDEKFVEAFKHEFPQVQTGEFQADMKVSLVNDGPVTIIVDTEEWK